MVVGKPVEVLKSTIESPAGIFHGVEVIVVNRNNLLSAKVGKSLVGLHVLVKIRET